MFDTIAHILGSLAVESIWAEAVKLGGPWLVLQFVVLTVICLLHQIPYAHIFHRSAFSSLHFLPCIFLHVRAQRLQPQRIACERKSNLWWGIDINRNLELALQKETNSKILISMSTSNCYLVGDDTQGWYRGPKILSLACDLRVWTTGFGVCEQFAMRHSRIPVQLLCGCKRHGVEHLQKLKAPCGLRDLGVSEGSIFIFSAYLTNE